MSISFGSSNSVRMMQDVLDSLPGSTAAFTTAGGGVQATFSLSSSPGYVTDDARLVLHGSSASFAADLSNTTAFLNVGNTLRIPVAIVGALAVTIGSSTLQFLGAII